MILAADHSLASPDENIMGSNGSEVQGKAAAPERLVIVTGYEEIGLGRIQLGGKDIHLWLM